MKTLRKLLFAIALNAIVLAVPLAVFVSSGALVGCAQVEVGQDPVVVNAERAASIAHSVFDNTFEFEKLNRKTLGLAVKHSVDELRKAAPPALDAFRAATKAYKNNRNAENLATMDTALKVLLTLQQEAAKYLAMSTAPKTP